ncbi:MAG: GAF domain-containing protein [Chloroflexi bacterium]|nr:GAF domain-containing protein [Chloroflexota bacterium]
MAWLNNLTLQRRIGLLVLTGLVVGLGLFSWLGIQSVNESVQRMLDERLTIARVEANHLDETLSYVLAELRDVDFNNELPLKEKFQAMGDSLRETFAKLGIAAPDIMFIDPDGKVLYVEPEGSKIIGTDMSQYSAVRKTLEAGQPTISGLVSSPLVEIPVVFASVPVLNEEGKIIGVLTASVNVEQSTNSALKPAITVGETGYTEIVDGNGIVLARTKPGSPPKIFEVSDHPGKFAALISQGKAIVRTCHRCHEAEGTLERRRDVLAFAPLSTASWGVAIRQAEEEALAPTSQLRQRLLFLGLVVIIITFLVVWTMMQGVVKPVRMLTAAAKRVAAGDFKAVTPVNRQDEIGQLGTAFYGMTQELAKSRQELAQSRDELMVRNEELSALNSIAGKVNQSLNLEDVLETAMQKVLEVTRTTTGCVFLRNADGGKLEMMSGIGPLDIFKCQQSSSAEANCACHQVLRYGQTLMVNDVSQCPMLAEDVVRRDDISCFVTVPLKSKDRTLGIMNIACSGERYFTENDFSILDSIAYHVGLAIENSVLYEEAKQRDELRGQLLNSVINAQEEERKRIARELHDEYGQSLTVLKINIESMENISPPNQSQLEEKLKNARSLVDSALENLRRLAFDLRPYALDQLGLTTAIRAYAQRHLESAGIQVDFESKGLKGRLEPTVETVLFRIIQEAVHNIAKHAEAHHVRIQLEAKDGKITATIQDDGKGFNVEDIFRSKIGVQSLGLLGIQERATLLGGTFNIKSWLGEGTCLTVEIPLSSSPEESSQVKTR